MGIKAITFNGRSDIKEIRINGGVFFRKQVTPSWEYPVKTGDTLRITQVWAAKSSPPRLSIDRLAAYNLTLSGISGYGWELTQSVANPDSTVYDGVYQSLNKGVNSSQSVMRIDFEDYPDFRIYIRSYAESNYDYTIASTLDAASYPTTYSGTTAKAHTRGNQKSGTAISNYTEVIYENDGGAHHIFVVFVKDSSAASGDDRGYVLIKR